MKQPCPLSAPRRVRRWRWSVAVLACGLGSACSGASEGGEDSLAGEPEFGLNEPAALEAVLEIERVYAVGSATGNGSEAGVAAAETESGGAVAQFMLLPEGLTGADEAQAALQRAGLQPELPEVGQCAWGEEQLGQPVEEAREPEDYPLAEPIELVAAGDVTIVADGFVTELALNSFPLSGAAAGVVYTTRDRAPEPLPMSADYVVEVSGSVEVPQLRLEARAPDPVQELSLGGVPAEEARSLGSDEPLRLEWAPGAGGDIVYAQLSDGELSGVCAFSDAAGNGTVPADVTALWSPGEAVRLSVHRVRQQVVAAQPHRGRDDGLMSAMVRFDFSSAQTLHSN